MNTLTLSILLILLILSLPFETNLAGAAFVIPKKRPALIVGTMTRKHAVLGRFEEVDPEWTGTSYSYVRPNKEKRPSIASDCQSFDFDNCGSITVQQHVDQVNPDGTSGTGFQLWSSALAISEYLDDRFADDAELSWNHLVQSSTTSAPPTCLELGAGLGLPSIVLARHGFQVLSTDHEPQVLSLLEQNIQANVKDTVNITVQALDWANPPETIIEELAPDLILASDVVWNGTRPVWRPFVSLLNRLRQNRRDTLNPISLTTDGNSTNTDPRILMGYTQRRLDMTVEEEGQFFALLKHYGMQARTLPPDIAPYSDHWPLTVLMELSWTD